MYNNNIEEKMLMLNQIEKYKKGGKKRCNVKLKDGLSLGNKTVI